MKRPRDLANVALIAVAGVTAGLEGCAAAGSGQGGLAAVEPPWEAMLHVDNQNRHDVRVYLLLDHGGPPVRLGLVTSMTTALIRVRQPLMNTAPRLLIQPLATRDSYVTPAVVLERGETMRLTVRNSLPLTTLTVAGG